MAELRILAQGKYLRLVDQGSWEFVQRVKGKAPVGIVAVNDRNQLLLVEQFRRPIGKAVLELPAGLVGDLPGHEDEDLTTAAKRELLEETGYEAREIEFLVEGPTSPGLCDETMRLVRAHGLRKSPHPPQDPSEQIILHEVLLAEVPGWLAARQGGGTPVDPKVYAGLYFIQCR